MGDDLHETVDDRLRADGQRYTSQRRALVELLATHLRSVQTSAVPVINWAGPRERLAEAAASLRPPLLCKGGPGGVAPPGVPASSARRAPSRSSRSYSARAPNPPPARNKNSRRDAGLTKWGRGELTRGSGNSIGRNPEGIDQ